MTLALAIAQSLLAFAMLGAGLMKLLTPYGRFVEKMPWAKTWPAGLVKLLALAQVLGAVGLIVPWVTGVLPTLAPVAAVCLLVLMLGAIRTHIVLREPFVAPAVLAACAAFVALGRFGLLGAA
jgi:hypothetical protein